ncbi:MAG: response regulator transcription factor [Lachnospiraceae bacterium]|nr:response regulator transcription factor [Lachnospiraceae bacterium]
MHKILIIEDDRVIAQAIQKQITTWGYEAVAVQDFRKVLETFVEVGPQLVLLDISLPFYNGYHWCSEIRKVSKVPIIFISSNSDNMNIVMAMNMGADDFIAKPFDLNVLIAKIQALLRRTYDFVGESTLIEHGGLLLNCNDTTVTYEKKRKELTKNEFRILQLLMEHHGSVVSRESIMQTLWESDNFIDDNTLTVNVTRLRRKLEVLGKFDYIKTKKGLGYIIE